ncbi:MAG TPA: hypothetical protein VL346_08875 [Acidobacteriaceae bacterium]|nr:hypothetical protein [Acidobacteriaceae bacterium]
MQSPLSQTIVIDLDILLSVAVFGLFSRPALRKAYPWLSSYLALRAITSILVWFLLYGPVLTTTRAYTIAYFIVHWTSYLASAVLLFMSCLDVYREAMAPLPGLVRMGSTVFKWAALASALVTATTLTSVAFGPGMVVQIGIQMMRCVATAELCLLAFLILSMKTIGLSPRNRPFGIALGLGLIAASDCIQSSLIGVHFTLSSTGQVAFESISVLTLAIWVAYAVLPEPARKPVTVAVNSAIYKWDQIASALGHKNTQVVVQPAQSFFLVDVEKVVDRAFVRTIQGKESES